MSDKKTSVFSHHANTTTINRTGWKTVRLGEVGDFFKGGGFSMKDTCAIGIPCTMYGDLYVKYSIKFSKVDYFIPRSIAKKSVFAQNGDLLFTASGETAEEIGKCVGYFGDASICIGGDIIAIRPHKEFDSEFLAYILNSQECIRQKSRFGQGDAVVHISASNLGNVSLSLPPLATQRAIASSLSAIDEHIAALRRLITKQEMIKKSTLKMLLQPKEGWKTVRLGEVCTAFSYGVSAQAISYDGRNKYIRITDIDDGTRMFNPQPLMSPAYFDLDHVVEDGCILFARTGASVGKSYLCDPQDGRLIFAGFLINAKVNEIVANPKFVFLQTLTTDYHNWVASESMRTGQPGLNIEQYKQYTFKLPSINEQRAIAASLSAIDSHLSSLQTKLKKNEYIKAGMMRYFFSFAK